MGALQAPLADPRVVRTCKSKAASQGVRSLKAIAEELVQKHPELCVTTEVENRESGVQKKSRFCGSHEADFQPSSCQPGQHEELPVQEAAPDLTARLVQEGMG